LYCCCWRKELVARGVAEEGAGLAAGLMLMLILILILLLVLRLMLLLLLLLIGAEADTGVGSVRCGRGCEVFVVVGDATTSDRPGRFLFRTHRILPFLLGD
jgi:hypothetical protein